MTTPEQWQTGLFNTVTDNQAKTHDALTKAQQAERDALRAWMAANPYPTSTQPPTQPPVEQPPTTTQPPTGPAVFVGDYSPGNFSQWDLVQCKGYNSAAKNFPATGQYQAQIVNDAKYGKAARYEVRSGDNPGFSPGTERSEVQTGSHGDEREGGTVWYRFQTKFDPSFPKNHASLGWGVVNQWHGSGSTGSPPVGWYVDRVNGKWSLVVNQQSAPGSFMSNKSIFDLPLGNDWHDIKMCIKWSASDSAGFIQLWYNGVRQKFISGADTHKMRTMIPGQGSVYYKEGYYRQAMSPTGIVFHTGYRVAATEEGVGK